MRPVLVGCLIALALISASACKAAGKAVGETGEAVAGRMAVRGAAAAVTAGDRQSVESWNRYVDLFNEQSEALDAAFATKDKGKISAAARTMADALARAAVPANLSAENITYVAALRRLSSSALMIEVQPNQYSATQAQIDAFNRGVDAYNSALQDLQKALDALTAHNRSK